MRKIKVVMIALILVMAVLTFPAGAIDWTTANKVTVGWDPVEYGLDAGERLSYIVYLVNAKTDPEKINPVEVGAVGTTEFTITLAEKGSYFVGARSVLEVDDEAGNWETVSQSVIAWSDDPQYVQDGATFGIRFYPALPALTGLRPVL